MIILNDDIYRAISEMLIEQINHSTYFSGTIEYDNDEYYSTLITTLMIQYKRIEYSDGVSDKIVNITPVWCEYKTYQESGEVCNSFSWSEFRSCLLQGGLS